MRRDSASLLMFASLALLCVRAVGSDDGKPVRPVFRAGANAANISPAVLPAIVNGGFFEERSGKVLDPLFARAIVFDDGSTQIAIVVVDSCMMPRELLDRAKSLAREKTGIPTEHMLIAATHTHSAPSAIGTLGCAPDPHYIKTLPGQIAESIAGAVTRLRPARLGSANVLDYEHTHCRRWIRRPDRLVEDPFGKATARANMHPGYLNPDAVTPSGPVDPGLTVLAVQTLEGQPIAFLANYSMHYFGAEPVSADYFGHFSSAMTKLIGAGQLDSPFVAMMSQGTSGDQHWMDYSKPKNDVALNTYADAVANSAMTAYQKIRFHEDVPLAMAETTLQLRRRVPDAERLAWARPIVAAMGSRAPKSLPEVYAREALYLHEEPERELKLQAVRIGSLTIAAIPNEVFALTGLKIKARSPSPLTFTMELANGAEGYIPPPEQHALGGYTTWPARTAGLEVDAEPRILEAVLKLLEKVSGSPRRRDEPAATPYSETVQAAKPWAYWRLEEMEGSIAIDASGHGHQGQLSSCYARYLEGPDVFSKNHAVYFAGGRITTDAKDLGANFSTVFWLWNGLVKKARKTPSWLVARDRPVVTLGIEATLSAPSAQGERPLNATLEIPLKSWVHIATVVDGPNIRVYQDGHEILHASGFSPSNPGASLSIGGGEDSETRFDGKLDEVAVFDRVLSSKEIVNLFSASRSH